MLLTIICLFVVGLIFGSFVSALVWRIHNKKDWVRGRSQCPACGHRLAARDMVPLFSWLYLRGRCRYCKKPISAQYPLTELSLAMVFAGIYLLWPGNLEASGDLVLFITWLAASIGLMALLVYDARWLLLPNKILYPTAVVAITGRLLYLIGFETDKPQAAVQWFLAVVVASGFFWLLYTFSKGRWIGFGDVRLGVITGTLLATPGKSLLMIFLASVLGCLYAVPELLKRRRKLNSQIPYGPFLITAAYLSFFFGSSLIDWYSRLIIP